MLFVADIRLEEKLNEVQKRKCREFVLSQTYRISGYYKISIFAMVLAFLSYGYMIEGKSFNSMSDESKKKLVERWKESVFPMSELLVDFFRKLTVFCVYSEIYESE